LELDYGVESRSILWKKHMKKIRVRKITDVCLWLLFCFMFGSGLLIHYRLLPGFKGGHGLSLFGMSRHEWGEYHLWAAYIFLAFLIVHLFLNYSFIKNTIAKKMTWRAVLLCGIGLMIVCIFLFSPISQEQNGGERGINKHAELQ
jgi:TRAP-type uncharacterized transport system fused permease subunit